MLYRLCFILGLCLFSTLSHARLVTEKKDGALFVKSATIDETIKLFNQYHYTQYSALNSQFPRIYFLRLPTDWKDVPESDDKHRIFIKILIPLILKINESILVERTQIEEMLNKLQNQQNLSIEEEKNLDALAEKYDVFTRLKDDKRKIVLLKQLLNKVDVIPPSILTASAGIYSNWGNSRLALEANSLYLKEVWYDNQGLQPLDDANADYHYKIYGTLEDCIADQILKINSSINYAYLRDSRKIARKIGRPLYGPQIAATLMLDSNLKNISGLIDYTFSYYKLQNTDYNPQLKDIK